MLARGEPQQTPGKMANPQSPGRAKGVDSKDFRPFRALSMLLPTRGSLRLTPGYRLPPLRGWEMSHAYKMDFPRH
jgi:hypothetical protein